MRINNDLAFITIYPMVNSVFSLFSPPRGGGGLFISGPLEGRAYWRGGGLIERGAYLVFHKISNGYYLFEL